MPGPVIADRIGRYGFGGHAVTRVRANYYSKRDGVKIALRVWYPDLPARAHNYLSSHLEVVDTCWVLDSTGCQVPPSSGLPVVLEYLPYRHADWTFERDHRRHVWFSSHGLVIVRGDLRGSGDSEGQLHDEYDEDELQDCCELVEFLSAQPWSNGKVGMYGKSWGGFNGLQVAALQPKGLSAVISLYSTDNRFATDIHYNGGAILGHGMLAWASQMYVWNARPPTPEGKDGVNDVRWRDRYLKRLKETASRCWISKWLRHQSYDEYWKHGSICEDYNKIVVPTLLIGGWQDGYVDALFRILENTNRSVNPNVKAIIGPWSHDWPDVAVPGPNINFMDTCLWWWLKHLNSSSSPSAPPNDPLYPHLTSSSSDVTLYILNHHSPAPQVLHWPGRWVGMSSWPPSCNEVRYYLASTGSILVSDVEDEVDEVVNIEKPLSNNQVNGMWCGDWCSFGFPDLPSDQTVADLLTSSSQWTGSPLLCDLTILGRVRVGLPKVRVRSCEGDQVRPSISCKLCDIDDAAGTSLLITWGTYNLAQHHGVEDRRQEMIYEDVIVSLRSAGYTVPTGHRLRLSIMTYYWPMIWPTSPNCITSLVFGGSKAARPHLTLPLLPSSHPTLSPSPSQPIERLGPSVSGITQLRSPRYDRYIKVGLSDMNEWAQTVDEDDGCLRWYDGSRTNVVYGEKMKTKCGLTLGEGESSRVEVEKEIVMGWSEVEGGVEVEGRVEGGVEVEGRVEGGVEVESRVEDVAELEYSDVKIVTKNVMSCDSNNFYIDNEMCVSIRGEVFFKDHSKDTIRRLFV